MNNHEGMLRKYFVQAKEQPSLLSRNEAHALIANAPKASEGPQGKNYGLRSVILTLAIGAAVFVAFLLLPHSEKTGTLVQTTTPSVAGIIPGTSQAGSVSQSLNKTAAVSGTIRNAATLSLTPSLVKTRTAPDRGNSLANMIGAETAIEVPTISFADIAADIRRQSLGSNLASGITRIGTLALPRQAPLGYILAKTQLQPLPETNQSGALSKITVSSLPVSTPFYNDYNPMVTADGRTLYFISNREHGLGGDDFWVARKNDRGDLHFSEPQNLGSGINTSRDEGAASFSVDGQTMYFTGCDRPDGLGECDIYEAHLGENGWEEVRNIREINSPYWEAQPTISADGRAIYFVSNRPGTEGDADIYVSYKQVDGTWSTPKNLGAPINTKKKEDSPFIAPGGDALYFSSAGHRGMGGLDFFVSNKGADGNWEAPQNLGAVFNTPNDERFITLPAAEDVIYFASSDGKGGLDLFMARRHASSSSIVLSGNIIDGGSGKEIRAQLLFVDGATGEVIAGTGTNDETGDYSLVIGEGSTNHEIYVYGLSDSLGEFRAKIELPSTNSYSEYHCNLVLGTPESNVSESGEKWLPELPVTCGPTPDQLTINLPSGEWGDLTILDAWGHHLIQTFIKSDVRPQVDLHQAPDGIYLVRFAQRMAVVSIDRSGKAPIGTR